MRALYGRDAILLRGRAWIERVRAGAPKVALITSKPGIGKSSLLEQIAAEAEARGANVAIGRAWEVGGAPAYWPWIQIFRALRMDEDPFARSGAAGAVLSKESRFAEFELAVRRLRAAAVERPLVLVLDDLHAADEPSLTLLLLLVRSLLGARVLVLGAFRDAELSLRPEVATLLAKIAREAELVPLARLSQDDVALWMQDANLGAAASHSAHVYRLTEGHPLYVVEALRLLAAGVARQPEGLERSRGALVVLEEQLGRLSPAARATLQAAAVFGREFTRSDVAAIAAAALDGVHEAMREAIATHVVVAASERDCFRFSHLLLRDRLYDELPPTLRAALHAKAGSVVIARGGDVQTAAHHLLLGQAAVDTEQTAEVTLRAGRAALSRLAFEEALRLARAALSLRDMGSSELAVELELLAAESLIRLGNGEGRAICVAIVDRLEREGRHELLARAALVYSAELHSGSVDERMVELLRRALAGLDTTASTLRARVIARLAAALTPPSSSEQTQEILALARGSLSMARALAEPETLLYVLQLAATVSLMVSEQERFAALEETIALARAQDRPLVMQSTLPSYLTCLLARGERAKVDATIAEHYDLLDQPAQAPHRVRWLLVRALLLALDGDLAGAERVGAEARVVAQSAGSGASYFLFLAHRLSLAQLLGRPELLASEGSGFLTYLPAIPTVATYVAWYLISAARRDEARQVLRGLELPLPDPSESLWELSGAAEACVLLEDRELGARLYPHALRAAGRMFWTMSPGAIIGPSARPLGDLALLLGRVEEAVRHYDQAIRFCQRMNAPALVELCQQRRALARAGAAQRELPIRQAPATLIVDLQREGDVWALRTAGGGVIRVKHGKGLEYLSHLVARPGRDVHVLELAAIDHPMGDAGPVLDAQAKAEYQLRLTSLQEELAEAERFHDAARASRAEQEIDALSEQLALAIGLGGRDRRVASDVERVRINVQRRLKDAIGRITALDPALGRYLAATIKTGTTCMYQPM